MKHILFLALFFISMMNAAPENQQTPQQQKSWLRWFWDETMGIPVNYIEEHGANKQAAKDRDEWKDLAKEKDAQIKAHNEQLTEAINKSNETSKNIDTTHAKLANLQITAIEVNQKIAQSNEQIAQSSQESAKANKETAQASKETSGSLKKYVDYMTSKETLDTTHKVIAIASDGANVAEKTWQFGGWIYRQIYPAQPTEDQIKHREQTKTDIESARAMRAFNACIGEHVYQPLAENGFPKECVKEIALFLKLFGPDELEKRRTSFHTYRSQKWPLE